MKNKQQEYIECERAHSNMVSDLSGGQNERVNSNSQIVQDNI